MTPEQEKRILAAIAERPTLTQIVGHFLGRSGPTVAVALQSGYWADKRLEGELAGLREALSQRDGLDVAAVEAAAKRGVEAAIAAAEAQEGGTE